MLKLKLLWQLLKTNWKIPIYLFFIVIAIIVYWNKQKELNASKRREHNLKSEKIELAKKDSLNKIAIAEIKDSLEGVSLSYQKLKVEYKQLSLSGEATQTDIGGRDSVAFKEETECVKVSGFTKTNPPEYGIDILPKPFSLEIEITDFDNEIYGIVKPSNSCVKIKDVKFNVAPDLKGACKDNFDKGDFFLGVGLASAGFLFYNLLK